MAKKASYNDIRNVSEDWSMDDREGLPYSGSSVQKFIKQEGIIKAQTAYSQRYGASFFDSENNTILFFNSEETKLEWLATNNDILVIGRLPLDFTGTINQIKINNLMGSTNIYFTTKQEENKITLGFTSQEKGLTDTYWNEVLEDAYFTVSVDKLSTGNYITIIDKQLVVNGSTLTFDVKEYLATGTNKVKINVQGVDTKASSVLILNATLTTMYLSPANFSWYLPFIEGTEYNLGGVNIGGAIDKTLKIIISNENGYHEEYSEPLGIDTYTTNAYFYKGLKFPTSGTGVYTIEMFLDAGNIRSDVLKYNIICVEEKDRTTAKIVAISNVLKEVINYQDNTYFSFVTYNGGASFSHPTITIKSNINNTITEISKDTLYNTATSSIIEFTRSLEIESEEPNIQVTVDIDWGNTQSNTYTVDNTASYPPVGNYLFYLQPSTRSNSEENREVILNQANKTYITDNIWNRVSFVEGIDGYTTINGRKCLYLPAYSSLEINYKPLESFNTGKTIDISFMVDNISNYNDPIITICDDASKKDFRGIIIYPDRIIVHTRDLNTNDLSQSYEIQEGALNSIQISYVKGYKVNYGNLITVAVNGGKKREFSFGNDSIITSGNIKLGSNSSDLAIYSLKVYDKGFSSAEFMQNFINSLPSVIEKQAAKALIQSVIDDSYNIDYDRVRGNFNTITVEMLNNAELPHYGLSKEYSAYCNTEFDFCTLPKQYQLKAWKFILKNCKIEGQGTTSMNYWLWNLRWRLDKSDNLIVIYPDGTETTLGEVHFDGVGVHPLVNRITAKKNWASGMQSHKMGATSAFNDLHKHIGLDNEVGGRVAVYQIPVFVFEKILKDGSTTHYNHICRGIYTVGPDKGDKKTFGWNNPAIKDTLITLEGLDHNIKGAGFDYPWEQLVYKQDLEAICVPNSGGFEAGLEVGNCGTAETEEEISAYLDSEFKNAYKVCYEYSPLIKGTSSSLETINRNVEEWGLQKDPEGHAYQRFEFWIDGEYDMLYLNKVSNKYEKNGINLLEQLNIAEEELNGKSIDEKNQIFIQKRIAKFKEVASKYWDIEDNMFYIVFCTIFGAKDNGIKNTYPYKMLPFSEGGRYKQRQDDLDSLFPYDNQGLPSAKFWCEWSDFSDENKTAYVFKGEHSNLVQLLLLAFPEVEKDIAHRILDSMQALSKYGSTSFDKLKGFFTTYFFDNAQNYFPISAYNKDIEDGYEEAWPQYTNKNYKVDTDPLAQVVGNAYETEVSWIEKRLVYIMSKYQYGPFGYNGYNDDSLGRITYRTQVSQNRTLTPAIPLYPAIANGVNVINSPKRIMDNESITLSGAGGTNTNVYIMAADYLSDIGDLKDLAVDSNQNPILGVSSKRLKAIKVGDENADLVTSNLAGLSIGECPSLIVIDARNLNTLTGEIDLSKCPRLQQALFSATDVRSVNLQNGSKLTKLSLPDSITSISLLNHKYLTTENFEYNTLANVEFYRVEGCNINSFQIMKDIYNSNDSTLKNIRVLGFVHDGDSTDIDLLYDLAQKAKGIDSEGNTIDSLPVFEGTLNIEGGVYEDTYLNLLELYSSSEETEKLVINVKGGYYIRFEDPEVLRVLLEKITTHDRHGLKVEDVEGVTDIGTWFNSNTKIEYFNEFEKFKGITQLGPTIWNNRYAFYKCSALESIRLPETLKIIGTQSFDQCTSLKEVNLPIGVEQVCADAFRDTQVSGDVYLPNLIDIVRGAFAQSSFTSVSSLGSAITELKDGLYDTGIQGGYRGTFAKSLNLERVVLPSSLEKIGIGSFGGCTALNSLSVNWNNIRTIGNVAFYGCTSLEIDDLALPNLTSLGQNAFYGVKIKKISDLGKITALPSGGSSYQTLGDKSVLEEVVLPSTISQISTSCFYAYNALSSINLEDVVSIGGDAFADCSSLSIELFLPKATSIGSRAFRNTKVQNLYAPLVTTLADSNFKGCSQLKEATLNGVKTLGQNAFYQCSELLSVYIPNVETISNDVFFICEKLTGDYNLPMLSSVGARAFSRTKIKSIKAPLVSVLGDSQFYYCDALEHADFTSLSSIGSNAFGYTSSLVALIIRNSTPPSLAANAIQRGAIANGTGYIYVPASSLPSYRSATNWATYESQIGPLEDYEDGGWVKFEDSAVEAICVANWDTNGSGYMSENEVAAVTSIGTVFKGNTEITSFDEFEKFTGVTSLSASAFSGCSNLTALALPTTIDVVGASALNGVPAPIILDLPNLTTLNRGLYESGCFASSGIIEIKSLGHLETIPNGYNPNTKGDFEGCLGLKKVVLPDTLVNIGSRAFCGCTNLEDINIPEDVETIGEYAFADCSSLAINDPIIHATNIGIAAFAGVGLSGALSCPQLSTLSVLNAERGQFQGTSLTKVADLGGITSIPAGYNEKLGVFHSCANLEEVILPSAITDIGAYSFYACSSLKAVTCPATTVPTLGSNAFTSTPIASGTGYIYVPDASVDAYKTATNWATYANQIKPLSEYNG